MTPKEKANDLFKKYLKIEDDDFQIKHNCGITLYQAKKSALICVDEIVLHCNQYEWDYWNKVKEEIIKL